MSLKFRIVFSLACAALFFLVCRSYGEQVRNEAEQAHADQLERFGGEVVRLVVASTALEPGDVVSESNVESRDWASSLAPEGAFTSLDDVVGREVSVPASAGVPLTELNFREGDPEVDVPEGHVALTIPVSDKLGIPRSISAGTRLDAYQVDDAGVKIIAHDLEALVSLSAQSVAATKAELTVSVLPEEVPAVLEASSKGDLRLVLPGESVQGVTQQIQAPAEVSLNGFGTTEETTDAGAAGTEGSAVVPAAEEGTTDEGGTS